jgi:hypothetical protein
VTAKAVSGPFASAFGENKDVKECEFNLDYLTEVDIVVDPADVDGGMLAVEDYCGIIHYYRNARAYLMDLVVPAKDLAAAESLVDLSNQAGKAPTTRAPKIRTYVPYSFMILIALFGIASAVSGGAVASAAYGPHWFPPAGVLRGIDYDTAVKSAISEPWYAHSSPTQWYAHSEMAPSNDTPSTKASEPGFETGSPFESASCDKDSFSFKMNWCGDLDWQPLISIIRESTYFAYAWTYWAGEIGLMMLIIPVQFLATMASASAREMTLQYRFGNTAQAVWYGLWIVVPLWFVLLYVFFTLRLVPYFWRGAVTVCAFPFRSDVVECVFHYVNPITWVTVFVNMPFDFLERRELRRQAAKFDSIVPPVPTIHANREIMKPTIVTIVNEQTNVAQTAMRIQWTDDDGVIRTQHISMPGDEVETPVQAESMKRGKPLINDKLASFCFYLFNNTKEIIGMGFRVGGLMFTAAHNRTSGATRISKNRDGTKSVSIPWDDFVFGSKNYDFACGRLAADEKSNNNRWAELVEDLPTGKTQGCKTGTMSSARRNVVATVHGVERFNDQYRPAQSCGMVTARVSDIPGMVGLVEYDGSTIPGFSGAPVTQVIKGVVCIVGIHTGTNNQQTKNFFTDLMLCWRLPIVEENCPGRVNGKANDYFYESTSSESLSVHSHDDRSFDDASLAADDESVVPGTGGSRRSSVSSFSFSQDGSVIAEMMYDSLTGSFSSDRLSSAGGSDSGGYLDNPLDDGRYDQGSFWQRSSMNSAPHERESAAVAVAAVLAKAGVAAATAPTAKAAMPVPPKKPVRDHFAAALMAAAMLTTVRGERGVGFKVESAFSEEANIVNAAIAELQDLAEAIKDNDNQSGPGGTRKQEKEEEVPPLNSSSSESDDDMPNMVNTDFAQAPKTGTGKPANVSTREASTGTEAVKPPPRSQESPPWVAAQESPMLAAILAQLLEIKSSQQNQPSPAGDGPAAASAPSGVPSKLWPEALASGSPGGAEMDKKKKKRKAKKPKQQGANPVAQAEEAMRKARENLKDAKAKAAASSSGTAPAS